MLILLLETAKRKREEDREKQDKINNGISKYFSAKTTTAAPKSKVSKHLPILLHACP